MPVPYAWCSIRQHPYSLVLQEVKELFCTLLLALCCTFIVLIEASGASVFALSQGAASSAAAKWMANKENGADAIGGLNLKVQDQHVQRALLDMSTTAQINDSLK